VTEAQRYKQLAQSRYAAAHRPGVEHGTLCSTPRSEAMLTASRHLLYEALCWEELNPDCSDLRSFSKV